MIAGAAAVIGLLAATAFAVSTRREHARDAAVKEAGERARAHLAPAVVALRTFVAYGTLACDDAALGPRAAPLGEPWAVGTVSEGAGFRWEMGLGSARMLHPTSVAESRAADALVDHAQLVIVLVTHIDTFSHWQGELVVVDLAAAKPRCWAPIDVDGEHGHFVVDAGKLRDGAAEALATITKVIAVAE